MNSKIIMEIIIEKLITLKMENITQKNLELIGRIKKKSNINGKDLKYTINTIHTEKKEGVKI